jgi:hypothetical protein
MALLIGMLVIDVATHVVFAIGTGAARAEQRVFGVPVATEARFIDPVAHRRPAVDWPASITPRKEIADDVN